MSLEYMEGYETFTRHYEVPEGSLFIKIANPEGDVWVDAVIGKNGTWENSNSHALGALAGLCLRSGVGTNTVIKYLREVTSEDSLVFGYDAKSIADALGKFIEEVLNRPAQTSLLTEEGV